MDAGQCQALQEHSVALLNSHYLFIRFKSEQGLSLVLSGSSWKIEPFSINLSRWYQSFKPDLDNPAIKPLRFPGAVKVGNYLCNSKRHREPIENG